MKNNKYTERQIITSNKPLSKLVVGNDWLNFQKAS